MSTLREAAQQALEALESCSAVPHWPALQPAITALRDALAQEEQEPVYSYAKQLSEAIWGKHYKDIAPHWKPLDDLIGVLTQIDNMTAGLAPPRREWQSLSEDENNELSLTMVKGYKSVNWLSRAIEAKLKEKNNA